MAGRVSPLRHGDKLRRFAESNVDQVIVLNGGSGIATPVSAIAASVVGAWGTPARIEFSGEERPGDPFSLVARPGLLADRGFAWEVPVAEGIARYVRWFRESLEP